MVRAQIRQEILRSCFESDAWAGAELGDEVTFHSGSGDFKEIRTGTVKSIDPKARKMKVSVPTLDGNVVTVNFDDVEEVSSILTLVGDD
jgi:transcription antitermination factor NusG